MSDYKDCLIAATHIKEINTDDETTIQFIGACDEVLFAGPVDQIDYEEVKEA
jgi:hypothetical protein